MKWGGDIREVNWNHFVREFYRVIKNLYPVGQDFGRVLSVSVEGSLPESNKGREAKRQMESFSTGRLPNPLSGRRALSTIRLPSAESSVKVGSRALVSVPG